MPEFIRVDAVHVDRIDDPAAFIPTPPAPVQTTVIGAVIGDLNTAPAIVAVRYLTTLLTPGDQLVCEAPTFETHYRVLGAEYLPATSSLPAVAARINTLASRLYNRDSRGDYHVLVDASSVGQPVIDSVRWGIIPSVCVTGVTVTANDRGDSSILWRSASTVGLRYLISRLQAILQGSRLHIPSEPAMTQLLDLLRDYEADVDRGPDLVRALALACASEYQPVRYDVSPDDISSCLL